MLDDVETRLECLRLATVLHENDVPEVTQLLATSDALLDYVYNGRAPAKAAPPDPGPEQTVGDLFTGFINKRRT